MKPASSPHPIHSDWKTLFRAAIFEPDKSIVGQKVAEAEAAILARREELFYSAGASDEKEDLEDALCLLRVLIACEHAQSQITGTAKTAS